MTSTLAGSTHRWPPPIIWPKYIKEVFANSHLDIFTYNFSFLSTSNTFLTCIMCSSQVFLKIRISSRYTITKSSIKGQKTSFMTRMKVAGALHSPNDITSHSYNPCFVLKVVFQASPSAIWI
jgi:hypothetical protein